MSNISLQTERLDLGSVDANANVVFNSIVMSSGNISYDSTTGVITLLDAGRYEFDWWVATQSSVSTNGAGFVLVSSQGDSIIGNSPIKAGEVSGVAVIEVTTAPVTVELQNNSTTTIYYSTTVPVKASLAVIGDSDNGNIGTGLAAYGGVYSIINQTVNFTSNVLQQLPMPSVMASQEVSILPSTITIELAGDYEINYVLINNSSSVTTELTVVVRRGGVIIPEMSLTRAIAANFGSLFFASTIVSLNAGDIIDMAILSPVSGNITLGLGLNASLSVKKLNI